jgi:hypothetical protein
MNLLHHPAVHHGGGGPGPSAPEAKGIHLGISHLSNWLVMLLWRLIK